MLQNTRAPRRMRRALAYACYAGACALMILYIALVLAGCGMGMLYRLLWGALVTVLLGVATALQLSMVRNLRMRRRPARFALWALFAFYCFALVQMLFLDAYYGRQIGPTAGWQFRLNLVPLRTIAGYVSALCRGSINIDIALTNLAGNLLAFLPMGVFLPLLLPALRRFLSLAGVCAATIVGVEVLQLALGCGSCDIDDFILNFIGALLGYALTRLPAVQHGARRLYL
nr:VanZ family protein [Maliibacterium massiliense]